MTFGELKTAVPNSYKIVGLSRQYEFWCKSCSHKDACSRKNARKAFWGSSWQIELSERLEKHHHWHEDNPNASYEEHLKKIADEASRQAMQQLNKLFGRYWK